MDMSVYKREWEDRRGRKHFCWYFHKTIKGVRYRDALPTAKTKSQAEEAERRILAEIHAGIYGKQESRVTFKEFAETVYLPWSKENRKSWKSDKARLIPLTAFFGKYKLSEVSQILIEKYKSIRRKAETERKQIISIASVNRELQLLHRIFEMARGNGLVEKNPRDGVRLIDGENPRYRWLKPDEQEELLKQLTGKRAHLLDIIQLGLALGLRKTNLLALTPQQVDFHRGIVTATNTKTGKDYSVPMNQTAREILERLVAQAKGNSWAYLFMNPKTGTHIKDCKKGFRAALKDAGITDFRFHDIRHTFGTRAADAGAPLTAIRDTLGHASIETTNRYAHATEEGRRRVVEAQEASLGHIAVTQRVEPLRKRAV